MNAAAAVQNANRNLTRQANAAAVTYANRVTNAVVASPNGNAFAKNVRTAKNAYVNAMTKAHNTYLRNINTAKSKI
jgi:hypothetical protein